MNIQAQLEAFYLKLVSKENLTTSTLLATFAAIASSYYFIKWIRMCRLFRGARIPGPLPKPIVGNFIGILSRGLHAHDEEIFKKYGDTVGYFEATDPVILCRDVDMIKQIVVKDFNNFVNRRKIEFFTDFPFNDFLTVLRDDEWKSVRSIVTTTFTTSKLKQMFDTMEPCIDNYLDYIGGIAKEGATFDAKDSHQKLAFDVICSCCFGIQTDSIKNPNDPFIIEVEKVLNLQKSIKFLIAILFPNFMRTMAKWNICEIIPSKSMNFFKTFVETTIEKRMNKEQYRNDFIQIMIDHEEKEEEKSLIKEKSEATATHNESESGVRWKALKKTLTNSEILAQAILFLLAGSETTATTMGYVAYLLAKHPDVQSRLREGVQAAYQEHGKVSYEMVNGIEYLDMVIDETMRLHSPVVRLDRECASDYKYKNMTIPKGTIWTGCIWALHRDPKIYPEPEKFDPERFSAENKKSRDNCAFLPFGSGPRNCIGLRFALLEIKLFVCKFLLKYEFVVCKETPIIFEFDNSGLSKSKVPIMLKVIEKN